MFANLLQIKKTEISHFHKYSDILLSTLAMITASSLLGYDATSMAHLCLGSFSHNSLQIPSSSVRLDGERCCTAIFRSLQRCSIGFKSGLWLGHSRTLRLFFVLLDWGEGSLSEVLSTLEQVFIKDLSVLCFVNLSLDPD